MEIFVVISEGGHSFLGSVTVRTSGMCSCEEMLAGSSVLWPGIASDREAATEDNPR